MEDPLDAPEALRAWSIFMKRFPQYRLEDYYNISLGTYVNGLAIMDREGIDHALEQYLDFMERCSQAVKNGQPQPPY